jgi:integrase
MLIAAGAPLNYVKEQLGHASIQITVDTYGHMIPGVGERYVDRLDSDTSFLGRPPGSVGEAVEV